MMKIDMTKAYDTIDCDFLMHVIWAFGFSSEVCNLINQCVATPWHSVVMNRMAKAFFKGGRGLCQGDPLSPYLFILVEEVFTRILKNKFEAGEVGVYSQPVGGPLVLHLLFADDMVIFANGGKRSVKAIKDTLSLYASWSGQVVNEDKSSIFFSSKILTPRCQLLLRLIGFSEGKFPVRYLGVPIIFGQMKGVYSEELVQCI